MAAAAYQNQVSQVMEAAGWPWPASVLQDPSKQPRFVHSVPEFLRELQLGNHLDQVVVFPGGAEAMQQSEVLDPDIAEAVGIPFSSTSSASSAYEVLERLANKGAVDRLKGKVMYHFPGSTERKGRSAGGTGNTVLRPKWDALQGDCPEAARSSVYLAEVRQCHPQPCDDGLRKKRKSTLAKTMRERCHTIGADVRKMLFWDDYSEGLFVGGNFSTYDLHVDCIPSSNVGTVFRGHKLLAIWRHGQDTKRVMRDHFREIFSPPISDAQTKALERACCVAMAPPGSIYVFSGTNAHTVCNVGFTSSTPTLPPQPCLCISSYEAFINLHTRHADVALAACEDYDSSDEDMEDFEEEVGEAIAMILDRSKDDGLSEIDAAARQTADYVLQRNPRIKRTADKELQRFHEIDAAAAAAATANNSPSPAAASAAAAAVSPGSSASTSASQRKVRGSASGGGDADGESDPDAKAKKGRKKRRKMEPR
eukprot:CAMPEP_0206480312 /NCGR_PEP_ID=MMETSP0324_2-20121206/37196_1 /ASSEMBLY_ACC=CAM_ASM_000836 /TAXON_ID=2866 /ORGANISM="Crypthecodinium cohnii, Strain Seligo" /LENGTH=479 /DNA_ID=CAMNT_0053957029 /DNA_START=264 /DNA_END=1703 /DNA_ORIENTATION=+